MNGSNELRYQTQKAEEGIGWMILVGGMISLAALAFGLRMWDKAGADIRAAAAQERIAEVLERRDGRPLASVGGYSFGPDWVCSKQSDQRTLCGRP